MPNKIYTLSEIADKLANGTELNEIERQMASGVIKDWLKFKQSTGRPPKYKTEAERQQFKQANEKRRQK